LRGLTLARSVAILREHDLQESDRYVDLAISLRVCDVDRSGAWPVYVEETDEELVEIGGRWDRKRRKWIGEARSVRIVRVPRGSDQEQPARWVAEWFRRAAQGVKGKHWDAPADIPGPRISVGFRRVWTLILNGGRRAGKSHLAVVSLAMLMILSPRAIVWAVSPTQDETDELEQAMRELLPNGWYTERTAKTNKGLQFKLANGSRLLFLSGHKPRGLKRGRCDMALLNESQNMYRATWRQLRGAVADRSGLVIMSCNPPDAEIGRWVTAAFEKARAALIMAEAFTLTAKNNPFADWDALTAMAAEEEDEQTFRREVLGEHVPIGDIVFHAWSDAETVRDIDPAWVDITREATKRELGREFDYVVGMDFQQTPHMVASIQKLYRDADGEMIPVVVDEIVVADADETDLVDALEGRRPDLMPGRWTAEGRIDGEGYDPNTCGVVMDASGFTQDGQHRPHRTSEEWLRKAGWKHLYYPARESKRNPDVVERCKVTNAQLKNAAGKRRMFCLRHCVHTLRAMRGWEIKNGFPHKRSELAHVCDATTYPVYRFFARRRGPKGKLEYRSVGRFDRGEMFAVR
jgi:PBSX family phage terminase large subunit